MHSELSLDTCSMQTMRCMLNMPTQEGGVTKQTKEAGKEDGKKDCSHSSMSSTQALVIFMSSWRDE